MDFIYFRDIFVWVLILFTYSSLANTSDEPNAYYMANFCGLTFDMMHRELDEVVLKLTSNGNFWSNANCQMNVVTSHDHKLSFKILAMSLEDCNDGITIYGDSTNSSDALTATKMCSTSSDVYTTPGSQGAVTFTSDGLDHRGGFKILITSFYNRTSDSCSGDYYKCSNRRCIKSGLYCNDRDNCGDDSDEHDCARDEKKENTWWIPIPCVLGGVLFLCCIRSHIQKKKAQKACTAPNPANRTQAEPQAGPQASTSAATPARSPTQRSRNTQATSSATQITPPSPPRTTLDIPNYIQVVGRSTDDAQPPTITKTPFPEMAQSTDAATLVSVPTSGSTALQPYLHPVVPNPVFSTVLSGSPLEPPPPYSSLRTAWDVSPISGNDVPAVNSASASHVQTGRIHPSP